MPGSQPANLKISFSSVPDIESLRSAVMSSMPDLLCELAHQNGSLSFGCNVIENELWLDFDYVTAGVDALAISYHVQRAAFSHKDSKAEPKKMTICIEWY